jgi:hypothetical protein
VTSESVIRLFGGISQALISLLSLLVVGHRTSNCIWFSVRPFSGDVTQRIHLNVFCSKTLSKSLQSEAAISESPSPVKCHCLQDDVAFLSQEMSSSSRIASVTNYCRVCNQLPRNRRWIPSIVWIGKGEKTPSYEQQIKL